MMIDRTVKVLLGAIAAGIWTLVVILVMAPRGSNAAGEAPAGYPALAVRDRDVYVAQDGRIYRFGDELKKPRAVGRYGPEVDER